MLITITRHEGVGNLRKFKYLNASADDNKGERIDIFYGKGYKAVEKLACVWIQKYLLKEKWKNAKDDGIGTELRSIVLENEENIN